MSHEDFSYLQLIATVSDISRNFGCCYETFCLKIYEFKIFHE